MLGILEYHKMHVYLSFKIYSMKQLLLLPLLCIAVISFGQVPNYVPTNGLVGYWPFNGNANDESGNGNDGTNNGATLTADRFGMLIQHIVLMEILILEYPSEIQI